MPQRVLITGISRHLAAKLAQRLERDKDVESIVGVDVEEPRWTWSEPSSSGPTSGTR